MTQKLTDTSAADPGNRPTRDSARTRRAILEAATDEFADFGYSGARVERIVARASTNMRLVYHHFGSKEELYSAVIEHAYEQIREKESWLHLDEGDPLEAMRRLVAFTIEHFRTNPAFLKLTTYENMQNGQVVTKSKRINALSAPLIAKIGSIVGNGFATGSIKRDIDPLQLYISIVSLACHHINNVHTLSATFGTNIADPEWLAARHEHVVDMVMAYLTSEKVPA